MLNTSQTDKHNVQMDRQTNRWTYFSELLDFLSQICTREPLQKLLLHYYHWSTEVRNMEPSEWMRHLRISLAPLPPPAEAAVWRGGGNVGNMTPTKL